MGQETGANVWPICDRCNTSYPPYCMQTVNGKTRCNHCSLEIRVETAELELAKEKAANDAYREVLFAGMRANRKPSKPLRDILVSGEIAGLKTRLDKMYVERGALKTRVAELEPKANRYDELCISEQDVLTAIELNDNDSPLRSWSVVTFPVAVEEIQRTIRILREERDKAKAQDETMVAEVERLNDLVVDLRSLVKQGDRDHAALAKLAQAIGNPVIEYGSSDDRTFAEALVDNVIDRIRAWQQTAAQLANDVDANVVADMIAPGTHRVTFEATSPGLHYVCVCPHCGGGFAKRSDVEPSDVTCPACKASVEDETYPDGRPKRWKCVSCSGTFIFRAPPEDGSLTCNACKAKQKGKSDGK